MHETTFTAEERDRETGSLLPEREALGVFDLGVVEATSHALALNILSVASTAAANSQQWITVVNS